MFLPRNWVDVSGTALDKRFCIVTYQQVKDSPPLVVTHSLVIDGTHHTWQVHVHGHLVDPSVIPTLANIPNNLCFKGAQSPQ